jgi:hypothetical protein
MLGLAIHFWGAARRAGSNLQLSSLSDLFQLEDLNQPGNQHAGRTMKVWFALRGEDLTVLIAIGYRV